MIVKFVIFLLWPLVAFAAIDPLKDPAGLLHPREEIVRQMAPGQQRVLIADYALIRQDFPQVRSLTDLQIDAWLIDQTGYMSQSQFDSKEISDPIPSTEKEIKALRPENYGRALVFEVEGGGLIDAKGVGAENPTLGSHKTGLLSAGDALREFNMEKTVDLVLRHAALDQSGPNFGHDLKTVGCYAVIDNGINFNEYVPNEKIKSVPMPSARLLRQAHTRSTLQVHAYANSLLSPDKAIEFERIVRRYGIATDGRNFGGANLINVQGTADGKGIVDFGAMYVKEGEFELPGYLVSRGVVYVTDTYAAMKARLGAADLDPTNAHFVQPDARLRVDPNPWTLPKFLREYGRTFDQVRLKGEALTLMSRKGLASRGDFLNLLHGAVGKTERRLGIKTTVKKAQMFQSCLNNFFMGAGLVTGAFVYHEITQDQ